MLTNKAKKTLQCWHGPEQQQQGRSGGPWEQPPALHGHALHGLQIQVMEEVLYGHIHGLIHTNMCVGINQYIFMAIAWRRKLKLIHLAAVIFT